MPIFEYNNKKYNINDEEVVEFAKDFPDATSVYEAGGNRYKINASETNDFLKDFPDAKAYSEELKLKPIDNVASSESIGKASSPELLQIDKESLPQYDNLDDLVKEGEALVEEDKAKKMAFENQLDNAITDNKVAVSEQPKDGIVDYARKLVTGTNPMGSVVNGIYEFNKKSDVSKDLDATSDYLQDAKRLQEMSKAENEQGDWGRFFSSFGKGLADKNTLSFGLSDLDNDMYLISVSKKMEEKGYDNLSKSEQDLLQAAAIKTAAQVYYSSDIGVAQQAGESTAVSIPYMIQYLLTGGIGAALTGGVKKAVTSVAKNMLKKGVDKHLAKIGAGIVANTAKAAAMTPFQPALYADVASRMAGNASFDEVEGKGIKFSGMDNQDGLGEALVKGYTATTIDNLSEMSGELLSGVGKIASKYGKKVPKVGGLIKKAEKNEILTGFDKFAKKIGWNGTVGEFFEEQVGTTLNALTVGDSQLSDLADKDQQLATLVSVAAMGGFFTGVNAGGGALAKRKIRRNYEKATDDLYDAFSRTEASEQDILHLENTIVNNTNKQNQDILVRMTQSGSLTREQFDAVENYIVRSTEYNSMNESYRNRANS